MGIWVTKFIVENLSKHTIQSLTLIAGVATALFLIFGTFFQSVDTNLLPNLLGLITEPLSLEPVLNISSTLVEVLQGLML